MASKVSLNSDENVIRQAAPSWTVKSLEEVKNALKDYLAGNPNTLNALDPKGDIQRYLADLFNKAGLANVPNETALNQEAYKASVASLSQYILATRSLAVLQSVIVPSGPSNSIFDNTSKLEELFKLTISPAKSPLQVLLDEKLSQEAVNSTISLTESDSRKAVEEAAKKEKDEIEKIVRLRIAEEQKKKAEEAKRAAERAKALEDIKKQGSVVQARFKADLSALLLRTPKREAAELEEYKKKLKEAKQTAEKQVAGTAESVKGLIKDALVAISMSKWSAQRIFDLAGLPDAVTKSLKAELATIEKITSNNIKTFDEGGWSAFITSLVGLNGLLDNTNAAILTNSDFATEAEVCVTQIAATDPQPAIIKELVKATGIQGNSAAEVLVGLPARVTKLTLNEIFEMVKELRKIRNTATTEQYKRAAVKFSEVSLKALKDRIEGKDANANSHVKAMYDLVELRVSNIAQEASKDSGPGTMMELHDNAALYLRALDLALGGSGSDKKLSDADSEDSRKLAHEAVKLSVGIFNDLESLFSSTPETGKIAIKSQYSGSAGKIAKKELESIGEQLAKLEGQIKSTYTSGKVTSKESAMLFIKIAMTNHRLASLYQAVRINQRGRNKEIEVLSSDLDLSKNILRNPVNRALVNGWKGLLRVQSQAARYNKILATYEAKKKKAADENAAGKSPSADVARLDSTPELIMSRALALLETYNKDISPTLNKRVNANKTKAEFASVYNAKLADSIRAAFAKLRGVDKMEHAPIPGKPLNKKLTTRFLGYQSAIDEIEKNYEEFVQMMYKVGERKISERKTLASFKAAPNAHSTVLEVLLEDADKLRKAAEEERGIDRSVIAAENAIQDSIDTVEELVDRDQRVAARAATAKESRAVLKARGKRWQDIPDPLDADAWISLGASEKAKALVAFLHSLNNHIDIVTVMCGLTSYATVAHPLRKLKDWINNKTGPLTSLSTRITSPKTTPEDLSNINVRLEKIGDSANTIYRVLSIYSELVKGYFSKRTLKAMGRFSQLVLKSDTPIDVVTKVFGSKFQHLTSLFGKNASVVATSINEGRFFRNDASEMPLVATVFPQSEPAFEVDFSMVRIEDVAMSLMAVEKAIKLLSRTSRLVGNKVVLTRSELDAAEQKKKEYKKKDLKTLMDLVVADVDEVESAIPYIPPDRQDLDAVNNGLKEERAKLINDIKVSQILQDTSQLEPLFEGLAQNLEKTKLLSDEIDDSNRELALTSGELLLMAAAEGEELHSPDIDLNDMLDYFNGITAGTLPDIDLGFLDNQEDINNLPIKAQINYKDTTADADSISIQLMRRQEWACANEIVQLASLVYGSGEGSMPLHLYLTSRSRIDVAPLTMLYLRTRNNNVIADFMRRIESAQLMANARARTQRISDLRQEIKAEIEQIKATIDVVRKTSELKWEIVAPTSEIATLKNSVTIAAARPLSNANLTPEQALQGVPISSRHLVIFAARAASASYANYLIDDTKIVEEFTGLSALGIAASNMTKFSAKAKALSEAAEFYLKASEFAIAKQYLSEAQTPVDLKGAPKTRALQDERKRVVTNVTRLAAALSYNNLHADDFGDISQSDLDDIYKTLETFTTILATEVSKTSGLKYPTRMMIVGGGVIPREDVEKFIAVPANYAVLIEQPDLESRLAGRRMHENDIKLLKPVVSAPPTPAAKAPALPSGASPGPGTAAGSPTGTVAGSPPNTAAGSPAPVDAAAAAAAAKAARSNQLEVAAIRNLFDTTKSGFENQVKAISSNQAVVGAFAAELASTSANTLSKLATIDNAIKAAEISNSKLNDSVKQDLVSTGTLGLSLISDLKQRAEAAKKAADAAAEATKKAAEDAAAQATQKATEDAATQTARATLDALISEFRTKAEQFEKENINLDISAKSAGMSPNRGDINTLNIGQIHTAIGFAESESKLVKSTAAELVNATAALEAKRTLLDKIGVNLKDYSNAIDAFVAASSSKAEAAKKAEEARLAQVATEEAEKKAKAEAEALRLKNEAELKRKEAETMAAETEAAKIRFKTALSELRTKRTIQALRHADLEKKRGGDIKDLDEKSEQLIAEMTNLDAMDILTDLTKEAYEDGLVKVSEASEILKEYEALIDATEKQPATTTTPAPVPTPAAASTSSASVPSINLASVPPAETPTESRTPRGPKTDFIPESFETASSVANSLKLIASVIDEGGVNHAPTDEDKKKGIYHNIYLYTAIGKGKNSEKSLAILFVPKAANSGDRSFSAINSEKIEEKTGKVLKVYEKLLPYTTKWENRDIPPNALPYTDGDETKYAAFLIIAYKPVKAEDKPNGRKLASEDKLETAFSAIGDQIYNAVSIKNGVIQGPNEHTAWTTPAIQSYAYPIPAKGAGDPQLVSVLNNRNTNLATYNIFKVNVKDPFVTSKTTITETIRGALAPGLLPATSKLAKDKLLDLAAHIMFYSANPSWVAAKDKAAALRNTNIKDPLFEERNIPINDPLSEASDWGDLSEADTDTKIAASMPGKSDKHINAPIGVNDLPEDWD